MTSVNSGSSGKAIAPLKNMKREEKKESREMN